jgi:hypothetical protein
MAAERVLATHQEAHQYRYRYFSIVPWPFPPDLRTFHFEHSLYKIILEINQSAAALARGNDDTAYYDVEPALPNVVHSCHGLVSQSETRNQAISAAIDPNLSHDDSPQMIIVSDDALAMNSAPHAAESPSVEPTRLDSDPGTIGKI